MIMVQPKRGGPPPGSILTPTTAQPPTPNMSMPPPGFAAFPPPGPPPGSGPQVNPMPMFPFGFPPPNFSV